MIDLSWIKVDVLSVMRSRCEWSVTVLRFDNYSSWDRSLFAVHYLRGHSVTVDLLWLRWEHVFA